MPGSTTTAATTASHDSASSAVITWDAVKEFASQFKARKDAACIPLETADQDSSGGKVLVTGGLITASDKDDNGLMMTTTASCQLLEWNVRRAWKFPSLKTARLGHAAVNVDGTPVVIGGADEETNVLASVEEFTTNTTTKRKEWIVAAQEMTCPRMYATALAVPTSGKSVILVLGGRDDMLQELDSMEIGMYTGGDDNLLTWMVLPQTLPTPRFGSAAILIDNQKLLLMGGYDGRQWQSDCYMCDIHPNNSASSPEGDNFTTGSWNDMPPLLEAVRFGTAMTYYQHVLLLGQTEQGTSCLQCFDCNKRTWIWKKTIQVPLMEGGCLALQEPYVYGLSADSTSKNTNSSSVFSCEMRKIDKKLYDDCMAVAVGAEAVPDDGLVDTPTIIAMDPVAVVEDDSSSNNNNNDKADKNNNKHSREVSDMNMSQSSAVTMDLPDDRGITLKAVTRTQLSEKSFYTGQLRKRDSGWVPHGEGLEVWVDTKEGQINPQEVKNSYYKGRFVDGYRHGLGEMYLRIEEKHYFGQFKFGSWEGIGTLKMKNRGFSYFGQFVSGEMTGLGRCSFRVRKGNQWVQKTYAGSFLKGKAHGLGAVSSFSTGKVEEYRDFKNEDLFDMGSNGAQVSPADDAIDC